MIQNFTKVVIGIAVVVGFLVVFLSMYTAVLERTREIGILKALGASPGYVLGILLRETVLLAVIGSIAGILMTYGVEMVMRAFRSDWNLESAGRLARIRSWNPPPRNGAAGRDRIHRGHPHDLRRRNGDARICAHVPD